MTAAPVLHFPQEDQPMTTGPRRTPVDTGLLWKSVDRLTVDRKQRLVRQLPGSKPGVEYVDVPSLWTQLVEAVASSNNGGGRGKSATGSRSPLDLAIEALMVEVERKVITTLRELGHQARVLPEPLPAARPAAPTPRLADEHGPLVDPDHAGRLLERAARPAADERARRDAARLLHDTRSDLRQLASAVVSTGDSQLITIWTGTYRSWVARAEDTLTADDESIDLRGIRGHACPICLALWVTSERDGDRFRDPALVIRFRDGQVQHVTCRACQAGWWRGDDVQQLTDQLTRNEAVYGPASLWGETMPRAEA